MNDLTYPGFFSQKDAKDEIDIIVEDYYRYYDIDIVPIVMADFEKEALEFFPDLYAVLLEEAQSEDYQTVQDYINDDMLASFEMVCDMGLGPLNFMYELLEQHNRG